MKWSRRFWKDKKKILPCAVYLEGEYGIKGLFVGVPGEDFRSGGAEQIIEIKLTPEEKAALDKSSASVRELVNILRNLASGSKRYSERRFIQGGSSLRSE